jgi:hypothetical protein
MPSLSPKKQSLLALLVLLAAIPLSALLAHILPPQWSTLAGLPLLLVGVGFWVAVRIRCPHCGARVVMPWVNPGALVLLWAARESCPKCRGPLEW